MLHTHKKKIFWKSVKTEIKLSKVKDTIKNISNPNNEVECKPGKP